MAEAVPPEYISPVRVQLPHLQHEAGPTLRAVRVAQTGEHKGS